MALPHARPLDVIAVRPLGAALAEAVSTSLLKTDRLQLLHLVLPAHKDQPEHHVDDECTIHCLEGDVEVVMPGGSRRLGPGELVVLPAQQRHSLRARSVSVWARFAQPSRLVWAKDEEARREVVGAVSQAAPTLFQLTMPVMDTEVDTSILDIWKRGFSLTYGAELRAERKGRSFSIVDVDPGRYERFGQAALAGIAQKMGVGANGEVPLLVRSDRMKRRWRGMSRKGKALSVIRLMKATTTFAGGVDYTAWKINRHAGTEIVVKPWQRRWPIIGALTLLPRLLRRGAIR